MCFFCFFFYLFLFYFIYLLSFVFVFKTFLFATFSHSITHVTFQARMHSLMESLYGAALQIWTLYRVAIKKRDARSKKRFVDFSTTSPDDSIRKYWMGLTSILTKELQRNAEKSQFLRSILVKEYPRARESMCQILRRLHA